MFVQIVCTYIYIYQHIYSLYTHCECIKMKFTTFNEYPLPLQVHNVSYENINCAISVFNESTYSATSKINKYISPYELSFDALAPFSLKRFISHGLIKASGSRASGCARVRIKHRPGTVTEYSKAIKKKTVSALTFRISCHKGYKVVKNFIYLGTSIKSITISVNAIAEGLVLHTAIRMARDRVLVRRTSKNYWNLI